MKVIRIISFRNLIRMFIVSEAMFSSSLMNILCKRSTRSSLRILTNRMIFKNLRSYGVLNMDPLSAEFSSMWSKSKTQLYGKLARRSRKNQDLK